MSAYADYEIVGKNRRGVRVVVALRAIATPNEAAATWILQERYPSATFVAVTRTATRGYKRPATPVVAKKLAENPVRRAG
jgi:hypothetical protein